MVFRYVFRYLLNNEKLIQKLSESYPVRRAARLFVSAYYRSQNSIEKSNLKQSLTAEKLTSFVRKFNEQLENAKRELKQGKK